jgi:hypothetical protein
MKIGQLNKEFKWESQINFIKNKLNENDNFWDYTLKLDNITSNELFTALGYMEFLYDFYHKLDFSKFPDTKKYLFHKYCEMKNYIESDNNLLFFIAKHRTVDFKYFENIIKTNNFLFSSIKSLNNEQYDFYNNFWSTVFKQENIPTSFLNKHYYYFYNNRDYFYMKMITHKSFFSLDQILINKYKNY